MPGNSTVGNMFLARLKNTANFFAATRPLLLLLAAVKQCFFFLTKIIMVN
jgi:hypothetical protein